MPASPAAASLVLAGEKATARTGLASPVALCVSFLFFLFVFLPVILVDFASFTYLLENTGFSPYHC